MRLSGSVTITYTNNSPDNLPFPVAAAGSEHCYRKDSRGEATEPGDRRPVEPTRALIPKEIACLNRFTLIRNDHPHRQSSRADFLVTDTRMQIRLPEALKAEGGSIQIKID